MTTTWWPSVYPLNLDTFSPALIDNIDEVIVDHPNTLAAAIIALQNKMSITNGVATGFGGVSFSPIGHAANPGAAGDPNLWINNSTVPGKLIFTDSSSVDHDLTLGGGTLDYAYDFGGAGAGNFITADSGAVEITVPNTSNNAGLVINQNDIANNPSALRISNAGTGASIILDGAQKSIGADGLFSVGSFSSTTDSNLSLSSYVSAGPGESHLSIVANNATANDTYLSIYAQAAGGGMAWLIMESEGSLTFKDINLIGGIPISEAGVAGLDLAFTATSIVGALNELVAIPGGGDLDFAYDFGGAGAGRSITADTGAVEITVPDNSGNVGLVVNQNDITNNPDGLLVANAGTGYAIKLSGLSNTIQGDDSVGLYCDSILTDSVLSLISTIPLGSANNAITYLNSINSGTGDSTVLIAALGSGGTDLVSIISGSGDITLQANSSLAIPFNDIVDADLDATFSSSSIVGALNELKLGSEVALTFSTGLTRTADTITADLSTGIAGGQSVIGGTAAGNSLTLSSTTNATKGNIIVDDATIIPTTNDGAALGTGAKSFSDLFLASGGVVNWGNGVSLLTHSAGALTVGGSVATTLIAPTVSGSATTANNLTLRANTADLTTGQVNVTSSLEATSASAAALTSAGGLGVAKRIWSTDLTVTNLPTLGGTQLTTTVARLNYLTNAAGTTGTNSTNIVFSTSPVLTTPTITTSINPSVNDGATLGASGTAFSDLFLASGGVINWNAGASTITHSANTLTIGGTGATTLALGTNSITLTGSIGATGARSSKGWFADLESTAGIVLGLDAATNTAGYMKLFSAGANNYYTTFTAGTQTANATYTLPTAMPTVDGMALTATTAGVMSWATILGGDSEDGMTVYKNIYDDFTADYASASTIEVWGLPFNINAVQIRKITRKPTGSAVSVVRSRGTDLICTWTPHATIQGRGTISTTSLGTCAATDEYIIEIEGPPKGYNAETDSNKVREINPFHYINDGLVVDLTSDTADIIKPLGKDNYNAISLNVILDTADESTVTIYGSNDPLGTSGFYDITDLACGVPVINEPGAYQTLSVIAFEYIKISVDSSSGDTDVYLTRFLKN